MVHKSINPTPKVQLDICQISTICICKLHSSYVSGTAKSATSDKPGGRRSVVRTHLFLCCGPRVGPDTIKTKEKSFRIDNRNSAGADGGPRSRVCACWTLRSAPHRHQQKCLVSVSAHSPLSNQIKHRARVSGLRNPTLTPSVYKIHKMLFYINKQKFI